MAEIAGLKMKIDDQAMVKDQVPRITNNINVIAEIPSFNVQISAETVPVERHHFAFTALAVVDLVNRRNVCTAMLQPN